MAETKTYNLPITGMTCANCVSTVERSLRKVPGVMSAQVNLSSERAAVDFDPKQASLNAMLQRVRKAGYDLAAGEADLKIQDLDDVNDAQRLERVLAALDGVIEAQVNLASEKLPKHLVSKF
jgi:Cu+-exporting ATPase